MSQRAERFARLIMEELSGILPDVKDPRVADAGLITITHVRVSPDLGSAHVLIAVHDEDAGRRKALLAGLASAQAFLRRELGRGLRAKKTPELRFSIDDTDARADRVEQLLREIAADHKEKE
jgi:ribosome-binding factor A